MIVVSIVETVACMTCGGARVAELMEQLIMQGSIPLCDDHAQLMSDAAHGVLSVERKSPMSG